MNCVNLVNYLVKVDVKVHFAFIFDKQGNELARGTNIPADDMKSSIHAEDDCITHLLEKVRRGEIKRRKLRNMTILIIRIALNANRPDDDDSVLTISKPCTGCSKLIKSSPFIKHTEYSTHRKCKTRFVRYRN